MPTSTPARVAATILGLEAVGIAVISARELSAFGLGDTTSASSGIALFVLTIIAMIAVAAFAVKVTTLPWRWA